MRACVHNQAVSTELLSEIAEWKAEKCTEEDIVTRLRARTVPVGYEPHTWVKGVCAH